MPATLTRGKVNEVLASLEKQGARIEKRGTGRRVIFPGGRSVTVHDSPSDVNWIHHVRRATESAGLSWPLDDSKAAKAAEKAYRSPVFGPSVPDEGDEFDVPEGPLEHQVVPPGVRGLGGRRPMDRAIGLVRGAIFNLGPDKRTFWTAEVADQLRDFAGFRASVRGGAGGTAGSGVQRCQGILDWLGYRVVEARPNRNGFIYRWALDPTKDRSKSETLPLIVPHQEEDERPGVSTLVNPPEPLLPEMPMPVEVKEEAPVEVDDGPGVPALAGAPEEQPVETLGAPAAEAPVPEPQPTKPPVAVEDLPVARPVAPVPVLVRAKTSDVETAREIMDDAGSWAINLSALGKSGKKLEEMIVRLGLRGELRVWRQ